MNSTAAILDQVVTDLDQVLGADVLSTLTDAERLTVLTKAGEALRQVEAVIVETVASADAVDLPHGVGCRNLNELLQRTLRVDSRTAAQVVKASKIVHRDTDLTSGEPLPARWPGLRQAMLDGQAGITGLLAATGPIESAVDRIGTADRWKADAVLAEVVAGAGSFHRTCHGSQRGLFPLRCHHVGSLHRVTQSCVNTGTFPRRARGRCVDRRHHARRRHGQRGRSSGPKR